MADNVPITAGSGTTVATDDIGGLHFQRVKLVDGTLDSTQVVSATTYGLSVDVARLQSSVTIANLPSTQTVTGSSVTVLNSSLTVDPSTVTSPVLVKNSQLTVLPASNVTFVVDPSSYTATVKPASAVTFVTDPSSYTATVKPASAVTFVVDPSSYTATVKPASAVTFVVDASTYTVKLPNSVFTSQSLVSVAPASGVTFVVDPSGYTQKVQQATAANLNAQVVGEVAHAASNSGNPLQLGMEAIAHGTNPTAVTAAQRTKLYANRAGVPFTIGGHPNSQTTRLQFTAAQTDTAIVTVATGLKIVVTSFQVTLDNASTVFPSVRLGFGATTTPTTGGVIGAHGGVPAGGGFGRGDGSGIVGVGADNEDLRVTTVGAATGNGVEVVVTYYTIES